MAQGGGASRPRFRLLPTVLLTAVILLLPTAVYAWGRNSSSFAVQRIEVSGTDVVPRRQVLRTLRHDYLGRNLFTVTAADVRRTLAPYCYVADAAVDRDFPDVLIVRVVEHRPVLYAYARGGWYVVAADGRVVCRQGQAGATKDAAAGQPGAEASGAGARDAGASNEATSAAGPAGTGGGDDASPEGARLLTTLLAGPKKATLHLPRIAAADRLVPGTRTREAGVLAAVAVVQGLPRALREAVAVIEAPDDARLTLRFAGGPLVVWGDTSRSPAKTLALRAVLARYRRASIACTFADVSVPDRVLARPVLK